MCVQQATVTSTQHEDGHGRYVRVLDSSGSDGVAMRTVSGVGMQQQTYAVCRVTAATTNDSLRALLQQKLQEAAPRLLQARRAVMESASLGADMAR